MKRKRYNKGSYKGPLFKVRGRNFDFDQQKAEAEEDAMIKKRQEIGLPGSGPVRRLVQPRGTIFRRKKPTIENKYLNESLRANPHYMIKSQSTKSGFEEVLEHNVSRSSSKESDLSYRLMEVSKDFFERNDLQNSKTLSKYDCWDNDLSPEEWVEKCNQQPERPHARCPFYRNNK